MTHDPIPDIEASIGSISPEWEQHAYTLWFRKVSRPSHWMFARYGNLDQCCEMHDVLEHKDSKNRMEFLILTPGELPILEMV